jgi:hypothetical protein
MKTIKIAIVLCLMLGVSQADFSKVGTAGAQFLKLGLGARAIGMGEAFTAMAGDPSCIYWNPAGLASVEKSSVLFSYMKWVGDIHYANFTFNWPMGRFAMGGLQIISLSMGDMPLTTIEDPDGESGLTFTAGDLAVGFSYSRALTDKFSSGITFKFVRQSIWEMAAQGFAIDLGSYLETGFNSLRIAVALLNFGSDMRYTGRSLESAYIPEEWYDLGYSTGGTETGGMLPISRRASPFVMPLTFRMGVAYDLIDCDPMMLTAAADLVHPNDGLEKINIGLEFTYGKFLTLRSGYKYDMDRGKLDDASTTEGISAGAGLHVPMGNGAAHLDYAIRDQGILGLVHIVTLTYGF